MNDDAEGVRESWIARVATERMILGGLLLRDGAIARVSRHGLVPSDFLFRSHRLVYEAALRLWARGEPVDVLTVTDDLDRRRLLTHVRGTESLDRLTGEAPRVWSLEELVRTIKSPTLSSG